MTSTAGVPSRSMCLDSPREPVLTRPPSTYAWTSVPLGSSWYPGKPTKSSPSDGRSATVRRCLAFRRRCSPPVLASNRCRRMTPTPGGVEEAITFSDPTGTTIEVFHGAVLDHSPVVTPFGARFVTGAKGLGHVVLPATDPNAAFDFYTGVLGFLSRGAWRLPAPPEFGPVRIRFLGVNERHHSLALVPSMHEGAPGLIHVMVEVDSLDAVGLALDRVNAEAFQLSSTLGRHTNDKMVSFYVRAPGGWDIEFGTDGMRVDEKHYTAEEITADSYWGHQWTGELPVAMRP